MITVNSTRNEQVTQAIATEIAKLPAEARLTNQSTGAWLDVTKREADAKSMSLFFAQRFYKVELTGNLYEDMTQDEKDIIEIAKGIASKAVEISGK